SSSTWLHCYVAMTFIWPSIYVVAGPLYRAGIVSLTEPDMALFTLTNYLARAMPDLEEF
ncbi:MAG: hypothetical protein ACI9WR_001507, partial [Paracoccaceae bacterium]